MRQFGPLGGKAWAPETGGGRGLFFPSAFPAPVSDPPETQNPLNWRSCGPERSCPTPDSRHSFLCVCVCVGGGPHGGGGKTHARQPSQLLCSPLAPLSDSVEGPGRSCGEIPYPPPSQGVWPGGSFPVTVTPALAPASGRQKVRLSTDKHSLY